jgi:hypothetical protein
MSFDALLASPLGQLNFVGFAGIVVWHLIPRHRANTRLVVQIPFFAVMTAILVGNGIAPHRFEVGQRRMSAALLAVSAKLLWWMHLAWAVIGFVRLYLVFEAPGRRDFCRMSSSVSSIAAILIGTSNPPHLRAHHVSLIYF